MIQFAIIDFLESVLMGDPLDGREAEFKEAFEHLLVNRSCELTTLGIKVLAEHNHNIDALEQDAIKVMRLLYCMRGDLLPETKVKRAGRVLAYAKHRGWITKDCKVTSLGCGLLAESVEPAEGLSWSS
jgi:hypothetical protein